MVLAGKLAHKTINFIAHLRNLYWFIIHLFFINIERFIDKIALIKVLFRLFIIHFKMSSRTVRRAPVKTLISINEPLIVKEVALKHVFMKTRVKHI